MRRTDPSGDRGGAAGGRPPVGARVGPPRVPAGGQGASAAAAPALRPQPAEATAPRSLRVADVATATLLLALGVLVIVASVRMGIGWGSDGPESGFVPFWLSNVLVLCCAIIIVHAVRRRAPGKAFVKREQFARVLQVLVPAATMIALTWYLGLYVASFLYMSSYMRWGGRHSRTVSIALPFCFVLVIFLVFERWFLVPLPKGPLETWLGY